MRRDSGLGSKVYEAGVAGLSTRRVEPVLEASGLKRSQVSRHLIDEMESRYDELSSRAIERRMLVVLMDGMHVGSHLLLSAVGMDEGGKKHVLGMREGSTESGAVARALLSDLVSRGLDAKAGILFVLDGAKALSSAVKELFPHARIQRCRVHKLRNVMDHLPETKKPYVRSAMQAAWKLPFSQGIGRMEDLAKELQIERPGAAASRRPGGDLHREQSGLAAPAHSRPCYHQHHRELSRRDRPKNAKSYQRSRRKDGSALGSFRTP
jgi:transposase-like protein